MPIAPFPHHYSVTLADNELAADPRAPIPIGAPPQFGGTETVWSPEQLLLGAAVACLKTTFDAYARRAAIAVDAWTGTATGVLDKGRLGPVFTSIDLEIEIVAEPGTEARIETVLAAAERDCIVGRALNAPIHYRHRIQTEPRRAAGNSPVPAA
jgi:organic hydroperoxide reductase OsmC/OhrA